MNNESPQPLRILQVNTHDVEGGAAKFAWSLFNTYRQRGHGSWMAVGAKLGDDPNVLVIPNALARGAWERCWFSVQTKLVNYNQHRRGLGLWQLSRAAQALSNPARWWDGKRGIEDFHFPGSRELIALPTEKPDILHLHNLHGDYFDLRVLGEISQQIPVVLTLHDEWSMTGHCACSLGCQRWESGCGECPDLSIYPAIQRDATAFNWRRKRNIYRQSRLHVAAPSQWLMQRAQKVMMSDAECRVIPNGVDLSVFHLANKKEVRQLLGLPPDKFIILFIGTKAQTSRFKDYPSFEAALRVLDEPIAKQILAVTVGDQTPAYEERYGFVSVRHVPFQADQLQVAAYYQAADLYIHATRTDNFPTTILESMACGVPVVATAVGGIPEQVLGLGGLVVNLLPSLNRYSKTEAVGLLVPLSDSKSLTSAIAALTQRPDLCANLGANAVSVVDNCFSLKKCADSYLNWYREILAALQQSPLG